MGDLLSPKDPGISDEQQRQEERAKADRIDQIQTGLQRQTQDFLRLFGRRGGFSGVSNPPILG